MCDQKKPLKAVVLAAGKGTRLRTEGCDLPKVMRLARNQPLLHYVLAAIDFIAPSDTVIVVGYKKENVISAFPGYVFAEQKEQLGTGHAVMAAYEALEGYEGDLLICCGDMPLLKKETYLALCATHRAQENACTILSGSADVYLPYGRIVRDASGAFSHMVEEKDATEAEKKITELNSGVYLFDAAALRSVLSQLRSDNAQGEYYLTDAPALMQRAGMHIGVCRRELGMEIIGVNTPEQLAQVETLLD